MSDNEDDPVTRERKGQVWSYWRDYEALEVCVQREDWPVVRLSPEEAQEKAERMWDYVDALPREQAAILQEQAKMFDEWADELLDIRERRENDGGGE